MNTLHLALEAVNTAGTPPEQCEALLVAIDVANRLRPQELPDGKRHLLLAQLHDGLGQLVSSGCLGQGRHDVAIKAFENAVRFYEILDMPRESGRAQIGIAICYDNASPFAEPNREDLILEAYLRALSVLTETVAPAEWALVHSNLITFYCDRTTGDDADNVELAIKHADEALRVRTRERDPENWAVTQNNLANALLNRSRGNRADNLNRAIQASLGSLEVLSREAHADYWAQAHMNLSAAYTQRAVDDGWDDLERSIDSTNKALTVYTRESAPDDWTKLQLNLSAACLARHSEADDKFADRALDAAAAALSILKKDEAPSLWGQAQCALAKALLLKARSDGGVLLADARSAIELALSVLDRRLWPYDWANAQCTLGAILIDRAIDCSPADIRIAIDAFTGALAVWSADRHRLEWAKTQKNLGRAYLLSARAGAKGDAEKALAAFKQAQTILSRADFLTLWAELMTDVGDAHAALGSGRRGARLDESISAYEQALEILKPDANRIEWAATKGKLGVALLNRTLGSRQANISLAIAALEAAVGVLSKERDPWEWGLTQLALSTAYCSARRFKPESMQNALRSAELARSIITPQSSPHAWAELNSTLAGIYLEHPEQHKYLTVAIEAATEALRIFSAQNHEEWGVAMRNLASAHHWSAHFALEPLDESRPGEHLKAALAAYRDVLQETPREVFARERLLTLGGLAKVLADLREWEEVAKTADDAIATAEYLLGQEAYEEEFREFIRIASNASSLGALAAARTGNAEAAWIRLEATRARLLSIALITDESRLTAQEAARLAALRLEIEEFSREPDIDAMQTNRRQAIRSEIARLRASTARGVSGPSGSATSIALTMVLTGRGGAILLRAGGRDVIKLLGRQSKEVVLAQMYGSLSQAEEAKWEWDPHSGRDAERVATTLSANIWEVLEEAQVPIGSRIIWIPPTELSFIPLGPGCHPSTGQKLIDLYEIVQAPSYAASTAAAMREDERATSPVRISGIFNPTKDLPYADFEGDLTTLVAQEFQVDIVAEGYDSRTLLKRFSESNIWHFATHGHFDWADFRYSGIELGVDAKGRAHRLTVEDLLYRASTICPRLVLLTACESGISDMKESPDELLGLPASFVHAGSAGVVATLWPVNDFSTALLVAKFYTALLNEKLKPSAALRVAQLWLRESTGHDLLCFLHEMQARSRSNALAQRFVPVIEDVRQIPPDQKPFVDAKFWGGFIYVGG